MCCFLSIYNCMSSQIKAQYRACPPESAIRSDYATFVTCRLLMFLTSTTELRAGVVQSRLELIQMRLRAKTKRMIALWHAK